MGKRESIPSARLEARLPAEVLTLLKRAAEIQGRSLSDFVVTASREAAEKAIKNAEVYRLALEDQRRFAEALINPPPLAPAMKRAREHHRRLVGPG
jgi:uncharacterized protein (DUF1778 family)